MTTPEQVPVIVMGVPWDMRRVRNVNQIAQQLTDRQDVWVVWDHEQDAMDTWRRTLEAAGDGAAVIVEDDVQLCHDWTHRVDAVVHEYGDRIVQFFSLSPTATRGNAAPSTFAMNQCYYLPPTYAFQLLEYSYEWAPRHPEHPTGYDLCMREWLTVRKEKYWREVPSLVQHKTFPSVISNQSSRRQSQNFIGDRTTA